MAKLKEIEPGIYEGHSPAKNEVRRFIKLPDGLTDDEMTAAVEAVWGVDTSVGDPWKKTVHLSHNLREKNEEIGGSTFVRFLADASLETLRERAAAVTERIARERTKTEAQQATHRERE